MKSPIYFKQIDYNRWAAPGFVLHYSAGLHQPWYLYEATPRGEVAEFVGSYRTMNMMLQQVARIRNGVKV